LERLLLDPHELQLGHSESHSLHHHIGRGRPRAGCGAANFVRNDAHVLQLDGQRQSARGVPIRHQACGPREYSPVKSARGKAFQDSVLSLDSTI